jgi:hypothetical protein
MNLMNNKVIIATEYKNVTNYKQTQKCMIEYVKSRHFNLLEMFVRLARLLHIH